MRVMHQRVQIPHSILYPLKSLLLVRVCFLSHGFGYGIAKSHISINKLIALCPPRIINSDIDPICYFQIYCPKIGY